MLLFPESRPTLHPVAPRSRRGASLPSGTLSLQQVVDVLDMDCILGSAGIPRTCLPVRQVELDTAAGPNVRDPDRAFRKC